MADELPDLDIIALVHDVADRLEDLPDAGKGVCCAGSMLFGPRFCTCWEPVYEVDQSEPDSTAVTWLAAGIRPNTRRLMCADCAYRPGSPERAGAAGYSFDAAALERIAAEDRFWCHQGIRRPVAWRHPSSGVQVTGHPAAYRPPIVAGVPYQANGAPGELCAGWAARRRALVRDVTK